METESKINKNGYWMIKVKGKWILEHRYVMEEYLNRKLKDDEKVHHIDFNKLNNEIDNLVIMDNKFHNHFHRQIKQFGYTTPRRLEIIKLKNLMEVERNKSIPMIQ